MTDKIEVTRAARFNGPMKGFGFDPSVGGFSGLDFSGNLVGKDEVVSALQSTAALQAECDALREALGEAREALNWYGEPVLTYAITQAPEPRSAVHKDKGKKAREALTRIDALLEKKP